MLLIILVKKRISAAIPEYLYVNEQELNHFFAANLKENFSIQPINNVMDA